MKIFSTYMRILPNRTTVRALLMAFFFLQASVAAAASDGSDVKILVYQDAELNGEGATTICQLAVDLRREFKNALVKSGFQVAASPDKPFDVEAKLEVDVEMSYAIVDAWVVFKKSTLILVDKDGKSLDRMEYTANAHGGHFKTYGKEGERYAKAAAEALAAQLVNSPNFASVVRAARSGSPAAPASQEGPAIMPAAAADEKLPPQRKDAFALVIGIDYKGRDDIPKLQYAAADARRVYDILTDPRYGGVLPENAILLQNEKASRNAIVASLRRLKKWQGYAFLYFSGHGAPITKGEKLVDAMLVPYDAVITDPDMLQETGLAMSYLQDVVNTSSAKGVLVAIDACFSGGGKSVVPKGGKPLVGMMVTTDIVKATGEGKIFITSSANNQQSWEDEGELQGGIFSHYLIDGLRGRAAAKEPWVRASDLADYIKNNVPKAAMRIKGSEQTPQVIGSGSFSVARNWDVSKVMDTDVARQKLKSAFNNGQISADQLSRAMDELKTPSRSKLLETFLGGHIDGKKFGDLY